MDQLMFDFVSGINSYGHAAQVAFGLLVVFLGFGVIYLMSLTRLQLNAFSFLALGFIGTLGYSMFRMDQVQSSAKFFPVGSCFKEHMDKDVDALKKLQAKTQAQLVRAQKDLELGVKMKVSNLNNLEDTVKRNQEFLKYLTNKLNAPESYDFVVVRSEPGSIAAYAPKISHLDPDFELGQRRTKTICSEELTQVVRVYEATGKLVGKVD